MASFAPNIIKIVSVNFGGNRMQYKGFTKQARKAMRLAENLAAAVIRKL